MIPRIFLLVAGGSLFFSSALAQTEASVQAIVQKGHSDKITALDFSRDGRFFVTGSADQSVKLWDLKTGREIRTFKGHKGAITDVRIDSQNEFIVSSAGASGQAELRIWDIQSGEAQNEIAGGKKLTVLNILVGKIEFEWAFQLRSFDLRHDGTLVWVEDNHGVKVGSISKSKYDHILPTHWEPTIVRYSPDGAWIAAGGQSFNRTVGKESNEVLIWNADQTDQPISLQTKLNDITTLSFDQSGKFLAVLSNSNDSLVTSAKGSLTPITYLNVVEVFDVATRKKLFEESWTGLKSKALALSPDGSHLATSRASTGTNAGQDHAELVIYDLQNKDHKKFNSTEREIYSIGFSPDGRLLIANGEKINFWRSGSWTHLREVFQANRIDDFEFIKNKIYAYRLDSAGSSVHTINLESGSYESWVMAPLQKIKHYGNHLYAIRGGKIEQYDARGKTLFKIIIEKIENWPVISDFFIHESLQVIICISAAQKDIYIQSLNSSEPGWFLTGHRKGVNAIALHGSQMASAADDNKIILWNLSSRTKEVELLGHNSAVNALDFNPEGTLLASGSSDRYVKLWDVKSKQQIETLRGHQQNVLSLSFNEKGDRLASSSGSILYEGESEIIVWDVKKKKKPIWTVAGNEGYTNKVIFKGNRVYSMGNDALIRFFNASTGNQDVFFASLSLDDFVISTYDNYYLSSKGSLRFVHFVKNSKVYAFDNFDLRFNRPDLVLSKLGSSNTELIEAYKKLYQRRLKRNGFTETEIDKQVYVPSALILNQDSLSYLSASAQLRLNLGFTDEKSPLKYYNVWVNSVPYFGVRGVPISGKDLKKFKTSLTIPLSEGQNKIEVGCTNAKGIRSPRELIEVFYTEKKKPDLYLVTVCVSEYADASLNLTYSAKDGRDMTTLFKGNKEFDKIHLTSLYNDQVTKANFAAIKQKLMASKPDDEVILFMAGHGILDKNFDFHFVTHDADMEKLDQTAITFNNIEHLVDSIPSRKKMILIDACHSGGIDKQEIEEKVMEYTRRGEKPVLVQNMEALRKNIFNAFYGVDNTFVKLMEEMFHNLGEGSGAYIISAASVNGYALESGKWNNGVFTYSILEGLSQGSADADHDGLVQVSELKNFLLENVVTLTGNQQRPTCRKENPDVDFVVWKR